MDLVALIPCRAGSKRVPQKNIKLLGGKPLLAWTIDAALESGIFDAIHVSTNDIEASILARTYGLETIWRPDGLASDTSPDIAWVRHALHALKVRPRMFAILRPTSPFRSAASITEAYKTIRACADCADSLRAIRPVTETPYKMWQWEGAGMPMKPLLTTTLPDGTPLHSVPTQTHPQVYIQTAALEMSWTSNVEAHGTISGRKVIPFFMPEHEALDINTPADWQKAEDYVRARGPVASL
jgi:CMP-N,N'-diacetyllegionaminic acid synthase